MGFNWISTFHDVIRNRTRQGTWKTVELRVTNGGNGQIIILRLSCRQSLRGNLTCGQIGISCLLRT